MEHENSTLLLVSLFFRLGLLTYSSNDNEKCTVMLKKAQLSLKPNLRPVEL